MKNENLLDQAKTGSPGRYLRKKTTTKKQQQQKLGTNLSSRCHIGDGRLIILSQCSSKPYAILHQCPYGMMATMPKLIQLHYLLLQSCSLV